MKIIIYYQHVLGVGHFFRTLELAKALNQHEIILVTGGGSIPAKLPHHIRPFQLPGLMMDADFDTFYSLDPLYTVKQLRTEQKKQLVALINDEAPDLFIVELYPFGRKFFQFELDPILSEFQHTKHCRVICSLRDILVEKRDLLVYENQVLKILNKYFDTLYIHSDPELIRLDKTFTRMDEIEIPVKYTGFVTPFPNPIKTKAFRDEFLSDQDQQQIVVSAGNGSVGDMLLKTVARAHALLDKNTKMIIITGPYMTDKDFQVLQEISSPALVVLRFLHDFVSLLAICDLSISMGGYNTSMNILATQTPALILPFDKNREQLIRTKIMDEQGWVKQLEKADVTADHLAHLITSTLGQRRSEKGLRPNLNGAETFAKMVEEECNI